MLRTDEAQRVAHGRLVELVKAAQEVCGAMNPDPDSGTPRNETGAYIEALGAAWNQASDGLHMLREAESPPTASVTVSTDWPGSSGNH